MVKVKVCGITNFEDAKLACDLWAYALGFIFYAKSPRYITPQDAGAIIKHLPSEVKKVGVFVNASYDELIEAKEQSGIDLFQLHGDETIELCEKLGRDNVIKAFRGQAQDYGDLFAYLVDADVKGEYGGTGKTCDWDKAIKAKDYGNLILSGGLNPDNIKSAINEVEPFAVDVSSGLEKSHGIKDKAKMISFFENIKGEING